MLAEVSWALAALRRSSWRWLGAGRGRDASAKLRGSAGAPFQAAARQGPSPLHPACARLQLTWDPPAAEG